MSEFYMIEAEESFIDGIEDITNRVDSLIRTVTTELLDQHAEEINAATNKQLESGDDRFAWLQKPFPLVTYAEAIDILTKHADRMKSPVRESDGLAKEHELFLVEHIGSPLFVINWPAELKPFYMRRCKDDSSFVSENALNLSFRFSILSINIFTSGRRFGFSDATGGRTGRRQCARGSSRNSPKSNTEEYEMVFGFEAFRWMHDGRLWPGLRSLFTNFTWRSQHQRLHSVSTMAAQLSTISLTQFICEIIKTVHMKNKLGTNWIKFIRCS